MDVRRLINLALAVFVTVGLAVAPLVAPVAAIGISAVGTADLASMSEAMPCCPDEHKSKDCQDCPLIAICALKTAQPDRSPTEALPLRHAIRTAHSVLDDVLRDGLGRPPPDHPPRTLA